MTSVLDSREKIKALDTQNLLGSVEELPNQIRDALSQVASVVVPESYKSFKNVVVSGMGGSVLGTYVIKNLFKAELATPFEVVSHYALPNYVNSDTLVLLSSYSGTTEETLATAEDAKSRGAKVMVITGGGPLAEMATINNWPIYLIKATYNPCNQPRLAIGYAIVGQLGLFVKIGLLSDQSELLNKITTGLSKMIPTLSPESENNAAKLLAFAAFDKHIILVGAEHLIGSAHVINNQFNENAKVLTSEWHLPEFNHHYMEALSFPKLAKDTTLFMLFNSSLYHERIQKRVLVTKELLEQKGYEVQLVQATAPTKLEQVFEVIQLGEFVAAYLPVLYGIDPSGIPNVDWFKAQMAK
jgi:glucose/mannose-6-phosphate isomerase